MTTFGISEMSKKIFFHILGKKIRQIEGRFAVLAQKVNKLSRVFLET